MKTRLGRLMGLSLPLGLALALVYFTPLQRWNHVFYDLAIGVFEREPASSIVLVSIDERSIERLGRWPWSRRIHARFLDRLTEAGTRAVGFDILFAEPDTADADADRILSESMARNARVVLPLAPVLLEADGRVRIVPPLPQFARAAATLGHVDIKFDEDNVVRQVYLQAGNPAHRWAFFALALWNAGRGAGLGETLPDGGAAPWRWADPMLIPFVGPPGRFQQVSYVDVLDSDDAVRSLKGRWVLVGMTAAGLGQRFATPVSAKMAPMSGPELHGQVLDALQRELAIHPLDRFWQLGLTGLSIVLPWFAHVHLRHRHALLLSVGTLLSTALGSLALMKWEALWFPPTAALLGQILGYPLWSWRQVESAVYSLSRQEKHTAAILRAVGDGVIATDKADRIAYMNPVAERLTGYTMAEARGRPRSEIVPLMDDLESVSARRAEGDKAIDRHTADGSERPFFLSNRTGEHYAVRVSMNPIAGEKGSAEGSVLALSDITETLRISQHVAYLATHDALTQLPNRVLLEDRLGQAVARARRRMGSVAVMFLDLDNFKNINDGLGHAAGDALLKDVATRLRSHIRAVDSAARWGGDEFVIVLEELPHPGSAAEVADKIRAAFSAPFFIAGQALYVSFSMGISLFPQDGASGESLLQHADAAMYRTKARGRNQYGYYSKDLNNWAAERLHLEKDLHEALYRGEFEVFYQPQCDPWNGRIIGLEALLRWHHGAKGRISPGTFIPLAEETGLIIPIGEWVIAEVCRQARAWQDQGIAELSVAVNLSPRQFLQPDLYDRIDNSIRTYGLPQHTLKLEITESLMTHDIDKVAELLRRMKKLGVSLAIDDFGTGYSSLSLLKRLPIDQLKIDKSFVTNIVTDLGDKAIAQSVISLAHNMKLSVIAEGVENTSQLDFFRERECDGIQGYYFSPPVTAAEATRLLSNSASALTKAV